jgi:PKD domain
VINGRRDIGAFEYQRQPPVASITQSATTAAIGQAVKFDGSASSDPDPGETVTYAWSFDDGATATSAVVSHAFATPGSHVVTLKVTDPTGLTGTAHATVTVPSPAPIITGLSQSAATWREGRAQAQFARKHRPPIGTTFRFALNVPASVRFRFIESLGGRKVGRKCVAKTHANRHRPTCSRTAVGGTLRFEAQAGAHTLRFDGRLTARSRLAPGNYTMVVSATDSSGRTSPPRSIQFKIARA